MTIKDILEAADIVIKAIDAAIEKAKEKLSEKEKEK